MDQNQIYLEMFALLGLYLPLFHRQKGPEPSCGLRTKLANRRRIVETEQQTKSGLLQLSVSFWNCKRWFLLFPSEIPADVFLLPLMQW